MILGDAPEKQENQIRSGRNNAVKLMIQIAVIFSSILAKS